MAGMKTPRIIITPEGANDYWCPKCNAHTKAIKEVMKNYYVSESGTSNKVIHKCSSCGFREMYKPIYCRTDWIECRTVAAYLLGIAGVLLIIDFLVFDFSFEDLKIWSGISAGLSIGFFLYALTRYTKWAHWKEARQKT